MQWNTKALTLVFNKQSFPLGIFLDLSVFFLTQSSKIIHLFLQPTITKIAPQLRNRVTGKLGSGAQFGSNRWSWAQPGSSGPRRSAPAPLTIPVTRVSNVMEGVFDKLTLPPPHVYHVYSCGNRNASDSSKARSSWKQKHLSGNTSPSWGGLCWTSIAGGCKVIVDTAAGGTQPPLRRLFRPFLKVGSLYGAINCLVAPTCGCK